jgi:hypothetical protein
VLDQLDTDSAHALREALQSIRDLLG